MAAVTSSHEVESNFDGGSRFVTSNPYDPRHSSVFSGNGGSGFVPSNTIDRKHSSVFSGDGGSGFVTSNPLDRRHSSVFTGNGGVSWTSNPLHVGSRQNQQSPLGHQQSTSWSQQSWDQMADTIPRQNQRTPMSHQNFTSWSQQPWDQVADRIPSQNQQTHLGHQQSSSWTQQSWNQMPDMKTSSDQLMELKKHKLENTHPTSMCHLPHIGDDLIRQFETEFKVVEKVAEMKEVEETRQKQIVSWERRLVPELKTVIVDDEVERFELVPVVKYRIIMKPETYYHVVEEEIEIPVTEQVPSDREKWVTRKEPRIVAEEVETLFKFPVVKQVPKTRTKQVISTEEFDDIVVMEHENPGQHNNLNSHISPE